MNEPGVRPGLSALAALATLLGATSLYPLFQDRSWIAPVTGAVVVVTVTAMVSRRLRLAPALDLLAGPAVLLLYVTALYAGSSALLWLIPTPGSLSVLADVLRGGWNTAETYAAPLPVGDGVRLLAVLGVGLVAVTVDLLAVRLHRAAPAGLPLLAMYSVPAAVRSESVHWLTFAAGSAGYLALLVADARTRVTGWGRPVFTPRPDQEAPGARPTGSAGRRVGLAAIAASVAVPALLPGTSGLFGLGERDGGGSTTITTADPLVDLKRKLTRLSNEEVLRYRTTSGDPDYLRIYALDRFDGNRWTYSPLVAGSAPLIREDRELPAVPGLSAAATEDGATEITVGDKVRDMKFLALPYAPRRVRIEGDDWRADRQSLMVFSTGDDADGMTYSVDSRRALPTTGQLRESGFHAMPPEYTRLPDGLPEELSELTWKVTAKGATPFDRAVLLQRWFHREFTYSLEPAPPSRMSDLMAFLRDREGYCEQFAATMALMTRELGIPSRVVVGYAPGTRQADGSHLVRQRDAHAWPELYFEGAGWVRFEPTPSGTGAPASVGIPDYTRQESRRKEPEDARPTAPSTPTTAPAPGPTPGAEGQPQAAQDQKTEAASDGGSPLPVGWILGGLAAALLVAAPRLVREAARRRRWAGAGDPAAAATAAWSQLRADTLDHGLGWHPAESPRGVLRRLGPALGTEVAEPLARITLASELSRYAPPGHPQRATAASLRADTATVRSALAASSSPPARWRARLFPPSSLDVLRRAAARLKGLARSRRGGGD
ncbi:transglutaminase family protein [Actinocorallia populi]|uniref:transglutaminase family protein n=1 Tax=Actinocorallia populi TaxID=2079200 RepID=UPI000D08E0F4|nr:DUF3488 and transglutaminase-like domain-containing protein [Actinocorallia populi]